VKKILIASVLSALAAAGCGGGSDDDVDAATANYPISTASTPVGQNTVWNFNVGDLNKDGLEDVVVGGWNFDSPGAFVYVLYQNPDGTLTDKTAQVLPNNVIPGNQKILVWDFDGNGWLDVVFPGFLDGSAMRATSTTILWGTGTGFARQNLGDSVMAHGACMADLNFDGRMDMIVAGDGMAGTGGVYLNKGSRRFEIRPDLMPEGWTGFGACAAIRRGSTHTVYFGDHRTWLAQKDTVAIYSSTARVTSTSSPGLEAGYDTIEVLAADVLGRGEPQFVIHRNGIAVPQPGPTLVMAAADGLNYSSTMNLGNRRSDFAGRTMVVDGGVGVLISGDTNNATLFRGTGVYKPGRFKGMAGSSQPFQPATVYQNSLTGKTYMLELLGGVFKTQEM